MNKTIGVFAHVDAGKTTFCENLLYKCGAIRKAGSVEGGDSVMDTDDIEIERKITVFSGTAHFEYNGNKYYIVDTPGHIDFYGEVLRACEIIDFAVLIVSEKVNAHVKMLWNAFEAQGIPVFIFINKTDRIYTDKTAIVDSLKEELAEEIIDFSSDPTEELAQLDDGLFDMYCGGETGEKWDELTKKLFLSRKFFPCISGSALKDEGLADFLKILDTFSDTCYTNEKPFSAKVFKIKYDDKNVRFSFIKVSGGGLSVRDKIVIGGETFSVNEIRVYSGKRFESVRNAETGTVCAVSGIKSALPGMTIGDGYKTQAADFFAPLKTKVVSNTDAHTLYEKFKILEEEEPLLNAEISGDGVNISVMGKIQLEVLEMLFKRRFDIDIAFGKCDIIYKETIKNEVIGCGHFEPLRHYAEAHIRLSPNAPGYGISFDSICPLDTLSANYQSLIKTHIFEKKHRGVLTGSEITDIKYTLVAGRAHLKHTEGGDFREAVYRSIRHGLMHTESVLLEPMYDFEISLPGELVGRLMSDIKMMCGDFLPPETVKNTAVLKGKVPVSEFLDYGETFRAYTKGDGMIFTVFAGYSPCHNAAEVIEKIGYNAESDVENTADSVFCSHGSGFNVKWNEAANHMHIKI